MKITALKAQVKNPERVSVYIDGEFFCGLNISQVLELGIKNNQDIEPSFAKKLKNHSDLGKLHMRAVEWLIRRPRSRRELDDYLFKKRVSPEEKSYVLGRVERYLDDEVFARFWVEGRKGSKNKSNRVIRGELSAKGVPKEVIDRLLSEHEITDQDALAKVATKKARQSRYQDPQKLTEYLLRQGFSYSDVKDAVVRVQEESDS